MAVGPLIAAARLPAADDGARAVRLLDADAARARRVRRRPVDHGVAADGGGPGRGRPGAERHRLGGQQRGVAGGRADRGGVHRRDRRAGQATTGFGGDDFAGFRARRGRGRGAVRRRRGGLRRSGISNRAVRHRTRLAGGVGALPRPRRRRRPRWPRRTDGVSGGAAAARAAAPRPRRSRRTAVRRRPRAARRPRARSRGRPAGSSPARRRGAVPAA